MALVSGRIMAVAGRVLNPIFIRTQAGMLMSRSQAFGLYRIMRFHDLPKEKLRCCCACVSDGGFLG